MLLDESSRPGLSALVTSIETYHEEIKTAKQSQTLLLGTIDDILRGRRLNPIPSSAYACKASTRSMSSGI